MAATPASLSNPARMIDTAALMGIRGLELRARAVVEGFFSGMHRSPLHGFSVEFTEYRQYTPGDDLRHLDWRVYGRSDRYFIRKYEDETNLRCHLLVDRSRSMTYGSTGWTKADYAATLAATLAQFLHLQGDATGLLTFDEDIRDHLPARHRASHLRQIMLALDKPAEGKGTDLIRPLDRVTEIVRKRGLMILISDFLAPLDKLQRSLTALSACGHEMVIFQVLDPAELAFSFSQSTLFEDVETGRTLLVDPEAARESYLTALRAHNDALTEMCRKLGIMAHTLSTDQPLERALSDFLQARLKRARLVRRARR